jgi:uncharacterized protein (DUF427 family)
MSRRPRESVWDYPRPPAVEAVDRIIYAVLAGHVIVDSRCSLRVLETSHPPVYYLPPVDVALEYLEASARTTFCEYKGAAHYYSLVVGRIRHEDAAWYYPEPSRGYKAIAGYIAFYAWAFDEVSVDGEPVTPQPGGFYGGWITSEIEGPFKGEPHTWGW